MPAMALALALPAPAELERRARVAAFLDTLLEPRFELRYLDFEPAWGGGERMLSVNDGEGDHAFAWFGPAGALLRGRWRDAPVVPPDALFAGLPPELAGARDEPAFQRGGDSFAAWRLDGDAAWRFAGEPVAGGLGEVLQLLDGDPATFGAYAAGYHARPLDAAALAELFATAAVGPGWLARLGAEVDPAHAEELARGLGLWRAG